MPAENAVPGTMASGFYTLAGLDRAIAEFDAGLAEELGINTDDDGTAQSGGSQLGPTREAAAVLGQPEFENPADSVNSPRIAVDQLTSKKILGMSRREAVEAAETLARMAASSMAQPNAGRLGVPTRWTDPTTGKEQEGELPSQVPSNGPTPPTGGVPVNTPQNRDQSVIDDLMNYIKESSKNPDPSFEDMAKNAAAALAVMTLVFGRNLVRVGGLGLVPLSDDVIFDMTNPGSDKHKT